MRGISGWVRRSGTSWTRRVLPFALLLAHAGAASAATPVDDGGGLRLHVASPDWRDQIIYFLMIDRFDDGDPSNNDQGAGEYDPADHRRFSGGDLRGVARRIDYIRGLGATTVWITPPVANQWWNNRVDYGGYHGYWAEDFSAVDAHFGTLDDYRALSHALHSAGMYLVQDIVTNHTGDYMDYGDDWRADDPAHDFRLITDTRGRTAPSQFPFSMNDPRNPAHREAGIYHWTPDIADYADPMQEKTFQMAGLDDLDTENPAVRDALRKSYGDWIREVGVDAFRVDTVLYVPPDYFGDFLHADNAAAPGILRVAAATGRNDFHTFGEGFAIDAPYEDRQARRIERYVRADDGSPLLPGVINFPLYGSLAEVFARGAAPAVLGHRIESMMTVHADPHRMPSFVDNHDVDRFLAGGSDAGLRQALLALMTLPGIPVIYYGTEQGFTLQRQAMFAAGWGSGGRDRFDTDAPLYRYLQGATALRRTHRVLSRGVPEVLAASQAGAGALVWRMRDGDAQALVVMNTADGPRLLDNLATGLAPGTRLRSVFAIDGDGSDLVVGADGHVHLPLRARHGEVWIPDGTTPAAMSGDDVPRIVAPATADMRSDFPLEGSATPGARLQLVIDGDTSAAQPVVADARGAWRANVATGDMVDGDVEHRAVLWDAQARIASQPVTFRVHRDWRVLAEVADPEGDDAGRSGRYLPPLDAPWHTHRPLDILGLRVSGAGSAVRVELQMRDIVATWNPTHGFDHVAPTLFLQLPGRSCDEGATVMPLQNGSLPGGMCWHLRLRAHGWSNALFSASGASAENEGTPVSPGATIGVDRERNIISFTFPAAAFGGLTSLSGLKVHANTWDYDVRYREIAPQPAAFAFGGGDGAADPLVMDETAVLEVP